MIVNCRIYWGSHGCQLERGVDMAKRNWREMADLLFADDGTVKLPKLTFVAISWAIEQPSRCLTRQPTRERAEAVLESIRDRCAKKGYELHIRPGKHSDSFGVYLTI